MNSITNSLFLLWIFFILWTNAVSLPARSLFPSGSGIFQSLRIPWQKLEPSRDMDFWTRTFGIYSSYKAFQKYHDFMNTPMLLKLQSTGLIPKPNVSWYDIHNRNSDRMMDMCLSLKGFYLKAGQFLSTRHDFMPKIYIQKLSRLQDDVPCMDAKTVRKVLEEELHGRIEDYFDHIDLSKPIGAASIAQVHKGIWKATKEVVAVKVQYPDAEHTMTHDLLNIRKVAEYLQKTEIKFDIMSAIRELQSQISNEFDFMKESRNLNSISKHLHDSKFAGMINVPHPLFSSKRCLVMTFASGRKLNDMCKTNIHRLLVPFVALQRRRVGKQILSLMVDFWGYQLFEIGTFHADPHPGNLLVESPRKLTVLDWGQVKTLSKDTRYHLAKMFQAIRSKKDANIVDAMNSLGIQLKIPDDIPSVVKIAKAMFDTSARGLNPLHSSALRVNAVKTMPSDLYFLVRSIQIMRGIAHGLHVDCSIADIWSPYTSKYIREYYNDAKDTANTSV